MTNNSILSQETNPLTTFPQFAGIQESFSAEENNFAQRDLLHNNKITQIREKEFIKGLEKKLSTQCEDLSHIKSLLKRLTHLPSSKANTVHQALFKQNGYFKRLFSDESWQEWMEDRTALGEVISYFKECRESHTKINNYMKRFDERIIQKANKESETLLQKLKQSIENIEAQGSCKKGLIGGATGSFIMQNPLPLLFGLSECFPKASAQQNEDGEFQGDTDIHLDQNFHFTLNRFDQETGSWRPYVHIIDRNGNTADGFFLPASEIPDIDNDVFAVTRGNPNNEDSDLFVQLFDKNGKKNGDEFLVNTCIDGSQEFSSHNLKDTCPN